MKICKLMLMTLCAACIEDVDFYDTASSEEALGLCPINMPGDREDAVENREHMILKFRNLDIDYLSPQIEFYEE